MCLCTVQSPFLEAKQPVLTIFPASLWVIYLLDCMMVLSRLIASTLSAYHIVCIWRHICYTWWETYLVILILYIFHAIDICINKPISNKFHLSTYGRLLQHVLAISCSYSQGVQIYKVCVCMCVCVCMRAHVCGNYMRMATRSSQGILQ
jgi:hypothetical protein